MNNFKKALSVFLLSFVIMISFLFSYRTYQDNKAAERRIAEEERMRLEAVEDMSTTTPQFVLLSFDGSKSISFWRETKDFAKTLPLHFTYFINTSYLLNRSESDGRSAIGYSEGDSYTKDRIFEINDALKKGHEIGSHTVNHLEGSGWTHEEWRKEFEQFNKILMDKNPEIIPSIKGFRAPNLGVNDNLYKTLEDFKFTYDASDIARHAEWPTKDAYGVWHIPLSVVDVGQNKKKMIAMDYTLFVHQSHLEDVLVKASPEWKIIHDDVYNAYMDFFNKNYSGERYPVVIGHHFEKWNDAVYWDAMKDFAKTVCVMKEVKCSTFSEFVKFLEKREMNKIKEVKTDTNIVIPKNDKID